MTQPAPSRGPGGLGASGPATAPPKPTLSVEQQIRHLALQEAIKTWRPGMDPAGLVQSAGAFAKFIAGGD